MEQTVSDKENALGQLNAKKGELSAAKDAYDSALAEREQADAVLAEKQTGVENAQNDVNWSNADYDKLIEESDKNLDEASRQEQLLAAEKILVSDDTVICPLFSASNQDLIDPSLTGYYNDGLAYTFWYNAHIKEDIK